MAIARVGVWWNSSKDGAPAVAARLVRALESHGVRACMDETLACLLGRPECSIDANSFAGCDLIAVLGGDGTLLSALDAAVALDIPLMGINLGRMGFLSEVEPSEIEQDTVQLVSGQFVIERRMLLEVSVPGHVPQLALNDAVFARSPSSMRVITVEVTADGSLADRFSGDGLIVASPTGSTAYSFSAGGPVVAPGIDLIVLTPICAHTLHTRPLVLPAGASVSLRALGEGSAQLVIDGRRMHVVQAGDCVTIRRSALSAQFIRMHSRNFFDTLRGKLTDWNV